MAMDGHITAWADRRPVYERLPEYGYQDNPVADWLTQWVDSYLTGTAQTLQAFYNELDPDTAQDSSLDYLASLVGLFGVYYDTQWSSAVKRDFIASVGTLFSTRGTRSCIEQVLSIHGYQYSIWLSGALTLPVKLPGTFGSNNLSFFLRLPIQYQYRGKEWREAERTLRNYAPAVVQSSVTYDRYYLGFSRLGQPLFSQ